MTPEIMTPETRENLIRIKKFIEENQHKYRHGITKSTQFSGAMTLPGTNEFYPPQIKQTSPLYTRYCTRIHSYVKRGYLLRKRLTPNGPRQWVVNEQVLSGDKTGVCHPIPFASTTPDATPKPIEEEGPKESPNQESKEKIEQRVEEFIMSELKSIKVRHALLVNNSKATIRLTNVTLYDIYKLGLSLEQTLGTEYVQPTLQPIDDDLLAHQDEAETLPASESMEQGKPF